MFAKETEFVAYFFIKILTALSVPVYIEDIQVFGVNMSFISLSEVKKKIYFMSAEGTNEIYNFSLH